MMADFWETEQLIWGLPVSSLPPCWIVDYRGDETSGWFSGIKISQWQSKYESAFNRQKPFPYQSSWEEKIIAGMSA
jgi:hypothetical protein